MNFKKTLIISTLLFLCGVAVQGSLDNPASDFRDIGWLDLVYIVFYVTGLLYILLDVLIYKSQKEKHKK